MLREQLEQAGVANEALSQDIRRLTADWTRAREELEQKESDWRREEEVSGGGVGSRVKGKLKVKFKCFIHSCSRSPSTATSAASTVDC